VREPLKIPFVHQRRFYARTLTQVSVLLRKWHNSRAHHNIKELDCRLRGILILRLP